MNIKNIVIALITPTVILVPLILIMGALSTYHNYRTAQYE